MFFRWVLLFVLTQKVTKKSRLQLFQGTFVTVNYPRHNSPSAQTVTLSDIILRNLIHSLTFAQVLFPEKAAGRRRAAGDRQQAAGTEVL